MKGCLTHGCVHAQGSHWSRRNRKFVMHDARPQPLSALVSPADVMAFAGGDPSGRFVLYSDAQKTAWVTELREGVKISLKRAESDLITVVPLRELKGLSLAPIGAPPARQSRRIVWNNSGRSCVSPAGLHV